MGGAGFSDVFCFLVGEERVILWVGGGGRWTDGGWRENKKQPKWVMTTRRETCERVPPATNESPCGCQSFAYTRGKKNARLEATVVMKVRRLALVPRACFLNCSAEQRSAQP